MDENLSLLPTFQNDYEGMAKDLRRMLDRFYAYRNKQYSRFILNFEETEYLNELVLFREYCLCPEFEYQMI